MKLFKLAITLLAFGVTFIPAESFALPSAARLSAKFTRRGSTISVRAKTITSTPLAANEQCEVQTIVCLTRFIPKGGVQNASCEGTLIGSKFIVAGDTETTANFSSKAVAGGPTGARAVTVASRLLCENTDTLAESIIVAKGRSAAQASVDGKKGISPNKFRDNVAASFR